MRKIGLSVIALAVVLLLGTSVQAGHETYRIDPPGNWHECFVVAPGGEGNTLVATDSASYQFSNASIVGIASSRQIKLWGGDQSASTHTIIDVTGYFA